MRSLRSLFVPFPSPVRPISLNSRHIHAKALAFRQHGSPLSELFLHSYIVADDPSKPDRLIVKFLAAPINPADINQIEGVYPRKPVFDTSLGTEEPIAVAGNEGLVEVLSVGDKVRNGHSFRVGDWAIMKQTAFGTWRTHAEITPDRLIYVNKEGLTPIQAATMTINPMTALRMIKDFVPLQSGDWIIQNGANGGVGQAVIQVARVLGLKTINIIRDRHNFLEVETRLRSLGADVVIPESALTSREFRSTTLPSHLQSSPLLLALNCVGGPATTNLVRLLSPGANLVTYGAMSKQPLTIPSSRYFWKDLHSHGFWVSKWNNEHPDEQVKSLEWLSDLIRRGEFVEVENESVNWANTVDEKEGVERVRESFEKLARGYGKKQILINY